MKQLFLLLFLLSAFSLQAQDSQEVTDLIKEGILYHDAGDYERAIGMYKKALDIAPDSYLVNYEIAMTYMHTKDYNNAIKYSDKAIKVGGDKAMAAYMNKGSCLNYLGKPKDALKVFEKAEKKFSPHYLLYFNWALVYYGMKEYPKAVPIFEKGIGLNPFHGSSHLYTGYSEANMNNKIQPLLSFYYFLMLEPRGSRAMDVYGLLQQLLNGNVSKTGENKITISLDPNSFKSEFSTTEMILPLMIAANTTEINKDKTEMQLFVKNTETLFSSLKESLENRKADGKSLDTKNSLWWKFYIPFFSRLYDSGNVEAFCYYISGEFSPEAETWLLNNEEKNTKFLKWIKVLDDE
ncbi:tetratricopeptide (TPR) repeat protein [Dysgonomonas sp. PFB1-18]|uniref:tetratricopeptide repeat protein n=1 Tax=unclassified Dysgonomonas TaxID=2630389 RepID=UPI002476AC4E|nr:MULTISPECIES: tetratricopeptide repeat protein [unclassified Dysgonomonas]MDH6309308.1 tetratricopeptide (TPR) repeat protein [Dysgonomonas sp. PF1-14]MDH6339827.1 tetratricopeptide (TPR) repeat protein [Dysgonomonas sp. PF1-16]MDH6381475.1 tetratricopeptide (TPR) repeat protein [Dysgonomonas sp. PFB1-18]MDH6398690.1 tetratricopeptide (TPR) repeat protein [Dysgonomonas sp. PF1-23]